MEASIDNEIFSYLKLMDKVQKEEALTVIKSIVTGDYEREAREDDNKYIDEMNKRFEDFEKDRIGGFTLEEAEFRARTAFSKLNK